MLSVLYVDDECELLVISRMFLEQSGRIRLDTAGTVKDALAMLGRREYDAIISDYQMPGMDGITFLKTLRSAGSTVPFILFTGRGREEVVIEALNNGADLYVQKGGDPVAQFAELEHKIGLIVEQRQVKRELLESQRRLTDIINFLPDATFAINTEGDVIAWNHAMEELTGFSKEQISGMGNSSYSIAFYGERRPILVDLLFCMDPGVLEKYRNVRRIGDRIFAETFIKNPCHPGGIHLSGVTSPLYDTKNQIVGAIESVRDISDLRKIMDALADSERKYRNVVEDQTEMISRFLPDGTHIFVNEAYCRYFNRDRGEIIGKRFLPDIPAADRLSLRAHFASLTPENPVALIQHRVVLPGGEIRWHRWSDRAIFESDGRVREFQSVGRDITEMIRSQEALAYEKQFSDAVINTMPGAFFVISRNGKYVKCNQFMVEALGENPDILSSSSAFHPVIEEDMEKVTRAFGRVFSEGHAEVKARVKGKRGLVREYLFTGQKMAIDGEEFVVGTGFDMTERYQLMEAIADSERKYRVLFENTGTAMFILENDMTISYANSEFERITGYPREDVIGKVPWTEFVVPEDGVWMERFHKERRHEGNRDVPNHYEFRLITKDNRIRTMFLSIVLMEETRQTIVSLVDVTDRKDLEDVLRQTNTKLNLVSRLTGHDLLNQLAVLQGALDLLGSTGDPGEETSLATTARKAAVSMKNQIRFAQQYLNLGVNAPGWHNLYRSISLVCEEEGCRIVHIEESLKNIEVFADPLFKLVFVNLFVNTDLHGKKATRIDVHGAFLPGNGGFVVVVQDDGVGIPEPQKNKIFDAGSRRHAGSGLGLVQEVLAITGLSIAETGEPGRGARFEISVPGKSCRNLSKIS